MRVIITGASRGIGRGIATVLAAAGMQTGCLARSAALLENLRQEIIAAGGCCETAVCDLREHDATQQAIAGLIERLGGVDVLINNAAAIIRKDAFSLALDEWRMMIATNIDGVFYATRAVLPHMRQQQSGHIINISSISGRVPLPGGSAYAATKYAVTGFSDSLFHEVRNFGIKVTAVFPGSVDSGSERQKRGEDQSWKVRPEEVGAAIRDLLLTAPNTLISQLEIRPLRKPD